MYKYKKVGNKENKVTQRTNSLMFGYKTGNFTDSLIVFTTKFSLACYTFLKNIKSTINVDKV